MPYHANSFGAYFSNTDGRLARSLYENRNGEVLRRFEISAGSLIVRPFLQCVAKERVCVVFEMADNNVIVVFSRAQF